MHGSRMRRRRFRPTTQHCFSSSSQNGSSPSPSPSSTRSRSKSSGAPILARANAAEMRALPLWLGQWSDIAAGTSPDGVLMSRAGGWLSSRRRLRIKRDMRIDSALDSLITFWSMFWVRQVKWWLNAVERLRDQEPREGGSALSVW